MKKIILALVIFSLPCCVFAQRGEHLGNAQKTTNDSLPPIAVIELFSSENCSSCPPADDLLNNVVINAGYSHQPIFVVEEHIDNISVGWVDSFANKQFTQRQAVYQDFLKRNASYTPQIFVNGTQEVIAASPQMLYPVIKQALSEPAKVTLTFTMDQWTGYDGSLDYHLSKTDTNWVVNFFLVKKTAVNKATGGENLGQTLTHFNVAMQMASDNVTVSDGIVKFSGLPLYKPNTYSIIAFVQNKRTMKIVGALQEDIN